MNSFLKTVYRIKRELNRMISTEKCHQIDSITNYT